MIMREKPLNIPYYIYSRNNETGEIRLKLNLTTIGEISKGKVILFEINIIGC